MYQIQNGFLMKDGKKTFVLGESYYPSFHPSKFPVPPDGDRIGEMKKDLKMMAEAGFNHVRFAALGDISYDEKENTVSIQAPLVDAMTDEAEKNDLSVSIRLQGFSVNLRGFTDAEMIDENGHAPNYAWCDFVRSTLHHPSILEDNYVHARDLAKHFSQFSNVIGWQIYNEPKFPQHDHITCDYNPYAVAAFRKWLVDHGVLTEQEARYYDPPRTCREQSPRMWALWRLFSTESLNRFLNNAAEGAKAGADLPVFTCLTADMACKTLPRRGIDPFFNAKSMDVVGYTIYKHAWGAEYYPMCLDADTFQCAAESEGKEAWCIELDSRTYIPSSVYNKGTYATLGAGVKGIVYYQWRGDCPVPGVPYPNSCGILNYDGTKTKNFDNAVNVNRFIAGANDLLVNAHRKQEGIGLLFSLYASAVNDAMENSDHYPKNQDFYNAYALYYTQLYTDLRRAGYTVTITDTQHLQENRFGIKVLLVPSMNSLSKEEREAVEQFHAQGGQVYLGVEPGLCYVNFPRLQLYDKQEKNYQESVFIPPLTPYDLPAVTGIVPAARSLDPLLGVQTLDAPGYTLLVITNISPALESICAQVQVSIPFATAEFIAADGSRPVEITGNILTVRNVKDGGIIILC